MEITNIISVAVLTEALIEYGKTVLSSLEVQEYTTFAKQLVSIALGIAISFAFHINAFEGFNVAPVIGTAITGIIISRGSNYASDIIGKIRG